MSFWSIFNYEELKKHENFEKKHFEKQAFVPIFNPIF